MTYLGLQNSCEQNSLYICRLLIYLLNGTRDLEGPWPLYSEEFLYKKICIYHVYVYVCVCVSAIY